MNETEFLDLLRYYFRNARAEEVKEILADYESHFEEGKKRGLSKEKKHVEKKQKVHKDKKDREELKDKKDQGQQRKLKPWEEKYYEQHPEAREQDAKKGNPEKKNVQDDDGVTWHRL